MTDQKTEDTLIKDLFYECRTKKCKIITVESCTGGLISSCITSRSGSSEFFDRGYVTYSNESKEELVGVESSTLARFGAVSSETVTQMAINAVSKSNRVSVAVTGVAGPNNSERKPVGLVWIASYKYDNLIVKKLTLGVKTRSAIRQVTAYEALKLLLTNLRH